MNISELKLEGLMDGVTTVGEFLEKYSDKYPQIDEQQFKNQLDYMDNELSLYLRH